MITTNIRPLNTHTISGNVTTQSQHQISTGGVETNIETDPIFRHSPAYTITYQEIDNWNTVADMDFNTYVKHEQLGEVLDAYTTNEQLGVVLDAYTTHQYMGEVLDAYTTNEQLGVVLDAYTTHQYMGEVLDAYTTHQYIGEVLSAYTTNEQLGNVLISYITKEDLSAQAYVTPEQLVEQAYITINDVVFPDYSNTYQAKGDYITPEQLVEQAYITINDVVFPDYSNTYQAKGDYITPTDLSAQAYLTSETDPVFSASPAGSITTQDINNWNTCAGLDLSSYVTYNYLSAQAYLTSETDPVFSASPAAGITAQDITNWNNGAGIDLSSYVTYDYLSAQSYIMASTTSGSYTIKLDKTLYVDNYGGNIELTNHAPVDNIYDISSVKMKVQPLNNSSYAAFIEPYIQHNGNGAYTVNMNLGAKNGTSSSFLDVRPDKIRMETNQVMISGTSSSSLSELYVGGPVYLKNGSTYYLAASYNYVLDQIGTYVVSQSYLTTETDPVFSVSPAATITNTDINNWNTCAGLDLSSYVTYQFLSDQAYTKFEVISIEQYEPRNDNVLYVISDVSEINMDKYVTYQYLSSRSYISRETDPIFTSSPAFGITAQDIINWNHGGGTDLSDYVTYEFLSSQSYLTSVTFPDYSNTYQAKGNYLTSETDPVFSASPAAGITAQDITNWNAATGGVDLSSYVTKSDLVAQSYLTTETDPVFMSSAAATITAQDIINWNSDTDLSDYVTYQFLSSQAYLTNVTFPDYSNTYQTKGDYITPTQLVAQSYLTMPMISAQSYITPATLVAQSYLTTETDPVFSASPAAGITAQDIINWNNGGGVDLTTYVTYDYLSAQSYITSVTFPDYSSTYQAIGDYVTKTDLVAQSYITTTPDYFTTYTSYAYFYSYINEKMGDLEALLATI